MSARKRKPARSSGHGGKRARAGRRPGALPQDLALQLSDVPPIGKPIQLARWYTSALALLSAARLRGANVGAIDKLAKEIRANATAAGKVLPHDIIFSAARLLKDDEDDLASDSGAAEEDRAESSSTSARADGA